MANTRKGTARICVALSIAWTAYCVYLAMPIGGHPRVVELFSLSTDGFRWEILGWRVFPNVMFAWLFLLGDGIAVIWGIRFFVFWIVSGFREK